MRPRSYSAGARLLTYLQSPCGASCGRYRAGFAVPVGGLPAPPSTNFFGEHYAQALVMRVSFFWGSFWGSLGGVPHISVILVKFLTVPLNRQIKVLYHGIESISR